MVDRAQNSKHKKRYSKISNEKRLKLVQMVQDQGFTLTQAAKLLHIKRPTAKIILTRYNEEGTFFNKKNVQARPLPILPVGPKHREISAKSVQQEQEPSLQLKVEEEQALSPPTTCQYGGYNQMGFLYFYPHFLDYHAFM